MVEWEDARCEPTVVISLSFVAARMKRNVLPIDLATRVVNSK